MHVTKEDVWQSINTAQTGPVKEGVVGAGTGTVCFGWKGGIGTASRVLPQNLGGYTVGVLVQTNFGGALQVAGVPVGKALNKYYLSDHLNHTPDGSCMMVVATDAPLDARNLERLAKRAFMGLAKTGGIASNGSGDYVIAFSTYTGSRVAHQPNAMVLQQQVLHNEAVSPLFMAAIEATEEAILNSLLMATTTKGKQGRVAEALPLDKVKLLLQDHGVIKK
jgi:D-aminopeptidase